MISQKTRYALRALLHLAESDHEKPVQLATIAQSQAIPRKYLELIMLELKKAGMVQSVRGPGGGYTLATPAEKISFGDVVRHLEGPIALVPCASVHFYSNCGDCTDERTCAIRRVMALVRESSATILDGTRLAEAAGWEKTDDDQAIELFDPCI
jgi:Rrf2 family protein